MTESPEGRSDDAASGTPAIAWNRQGLIAMGFSGDVAFGNLERARLPREPGVYAITTEPCWSPRFLPASVGGPHKGRTLTAPIAALEMNWRDGAEILYLGKAASKSGIADRVWSLARQGRGEDAHHFGGRYLWQFPDSHDLRVWWSPTTPDEPALIESALLRLHIDEYGARPWANLTGGKRLFRSIALERVANWLRRIPHASDSMHQTKSVVEGSSLDR